ncbi:oligosaccharide flippase family protein [Thomasclavelia cocleata]|uniref:oligosaccharide flippase family protein n=1 Tax=Thomasclavelia cocleata TaxID=69824 RepID=UPI00272DE306|nr:oligosaccharide flippase family protein [Thomasclavelia cocleata]
MKILKLDSGVATNSIMLMAVQIVTTVLGLIVTKLLSVHFSLTEYGTYSQALLVTTTATSISILGLTNATNYFYNRTEKEDIQKKYVATIFTIQYIVGLISAIMIILLRKLISGYFANTRLQNILLIVAFSPIMSNLIAMYQTLFVSIGEAKKIAVRNFLVSVGKLIAVLFACFIVNNIIVVLIIMFLFDVIQVIYFLLMFKKDKYCISIKDTDFLIIKEILIFSIPMAIYVLTNSLSRDIDKYIISAFANTETLAIYTNAAKILPFDMLTTSLITVLIPIITRFINKKNFNEAKKIFELYLRIGYILTFIFVGGAIAVANYLMLFLYDEKYMSGLPVFIIYLIIDMIRFANVTTILSGAGKSKILMVISVITLGANGIFNVLGYKLLGLIGPAVVTLIFTILMTIALLHFGAKEIETNIINLFKFKEMVIIGFQIIIFGTITHYIANFLSSGSLPLFFVLAISYGLYLLILLGLNYKRIIGCLKKLNTYK